MKNLNKYVVLFIWVVLFSYFYDMFMPKNILYFIVELPVLLFSAFFILNFFNKKKVKN